MVTPVRLAVVAASVSVSALIFRTEVAVYVLDSG